jgi:hypothetical protein
LGASEKPEHFRHFERAKSPKLFNLGEAAPMLKRNVAAEENFCPAT